VCGGSYRIRRNVILRIDEYIREEECKEYPYNEYKYYSEEIFSCEKLMEFGIIHILLDSERIGR